jgi:hypothetical protein
VVCATIKAVSPVANGHNQSHHPSTPLSIVALDLMGPYPQTAQGKRFVLVVTDLLSRWTEAFQITQATIGAIASRGE